MSSTLEERLKSNSSAFDGLLSLIPAKYYYDDDTQEQWKAKKQSKEEAKENKRAKLDPSTSAKTDQGATASQVLKKRAKDAKPVVLPGQKKLPVKTVESSDEEESSEEQEEEEEKKVLKNNDKLNGNQQRSKKEDEEEDETINVIFDDEGNEVELGKEQPVKKDDSKESSDEEKKKKEESIKALKEKLAQKINLLREKRKAPGSKVSGAPSSREAILEERRKKAALKEEKKRKREELEKDSEDEEEGEDDEEEDEDSDVETGDETVLYQNIQFDDNTITTSDLQNLRNKGKKKGPAKKDIKAHLKIIETKKQKLSQLDGSKQEALAEKEKWQRTIAHAEGQKLRDDEKLLKKALKKKEAQKRKSEIEWRDRKDHVQNMISAKAKRREENLQIRKDNKGVKRKHQTKQKRKFKSSINPKRAGFEGNLKSGKRK